MEFHFQTSYLTTYKRHMKIFCQGSCLHRPGHLCHKLGGLYRSCFSESWRLGGTRPLCRNGWIAGESFTSYADGHPPAVAPYGMTRILIPPLKGSTLVLNHLPKSSPANTTKNRAWAYKIQGNVTLYYTTDLYLYRYSEGLCDI